MLRHRYLQLYFITLIIIFDLVILHLMPDSVGHLGVHNHVHLGSQQVSRLKKCLTGNYLVLLVSFFNLIFACDLKIEVTLRFLFLSHSHRPHFFKKLASIVGKETRHFLALVLEATDISRLLARRPHIHHQVA